MPGWVSFAEIKERVSIEQVLRSYRVDWLRHSGPDPYRGRGPMHGGAGRDAFHVNVKRSVFHCFACGAGGNQLDFVAAREGCSVREAALRLQPRYGLPDGGQNCTRRAAWFRARGKTGYEKKRGQYTSFFLSGGERRTPLLG